MIKTTERLDEDEVSIIIDLMRLEHPGFENQEMSAMADQISSVFDRHCTTEDVERFYSDADVDENFELESHRVESNFLIV